MSAYLPLLVTRTPRDGVKLTCFGKPVTVPPELASDVAALTLDYVVGLCEVVEGTSRLLGLDMRRTERDHKPGFQTRLRAHVERGEFALAEAEVEKNRAEVEKNPELLLRSARAKIGIKNPTAALADWKAAIALGGHFGLGPGSDFVGVFEALYAEEGHRRAATDAMLAWALKNCASPQLKTLEEVLRRIPHEDWPIELLLARGRAPIVAPSTRTKLLKAAAAKGADVSADLAALDEAARAQAAKKADESKAAPKPRAERSLRRPPATGKTLFVIAWEKGEPAVYWTAATDELLQCVRKSRDLPDELVTFAASVETCVTLPLDGETPIAAFSAAAGNPPLERITLDELFELVGVDHIDNFY